MSVAVFMQWWGRQLAALIPANLSRLVSQPARPVFYALHEAEGLRVVLRHGQDHKDIGLWGATRKLDDLTKARFQTALKTGAARAPLILVVADGTIMQRCVTLPLAAAQDLDAVLTYEMDRLTPFASRDVLWQHDVLRRDETLSQIIVQLSIVPCSAVAPALDTLTGLGRRPTLIQNHSGALRIRLPVVTTLSERLRDRRVLRLAGGLAAAMLVIGTAFWHQSGRIAALESEMTSLRAPALEASTLRHRIEARLEGDKLVSGARQRLGDPLTILASLTAALPDDAYLTDLSLKQGELLVSGEASDPAGLIQKMSATPDLGNPGFIAPVTRLSGRAASLFSIRAEIGRTAPRPHKGARP